MAEYLSPGVYVEEVDTGSKTIEGVSTSTAGFVGMTERGPTTGLPTLVTSFADYQRKFGGYFNFGITDANYLPYAVDGFFTNGGKRLYIVRVPGSGATAADGTTQGGLVTRLVSDTNLTSPAEIKPMTQRGIQVDTKVELVMLKDGVTTKSGAIAVKSVNATSGVVTLKADLTAVFEARYTTVYTDTSTLDVDGLITAAATPTTARPDSFGLAASDVGSWGRSITIQATHESAARTTYVSVDIAAADGNNPVQVASTAGFYANAWVEINRGDHKLYRKVLSVDGVVLTLDGTALLDADLKHEASATATTISTCEFKLTVAYGSVAEQYAGLTLENITGRYYADRINNESALIAVTSPSPSDTHPFLFPSGDVLPSGGMRTSSSVLLFQLTNNGADGGAPSASDYKGTDGGPGLRTGIKALEDIDQVSIIAAPGITDSVVQGALIEQCELLKDRFAIIDPQNSKQTIDEIITQRQQYDTKYAAIYYPRLTVFDPLTDLDISLPPSGHMAGIYARTDIERGVHKAPANEVIRGITGLELTINKGEQDILNPMPYNINVLRDFRTDGRGFRVWGARCITSDSDWKYINVRRLFIFIEESIDQGTQWVVFEPNDEPLWARVRRSVSGFLTNVWRDGALQGKKPEEAFFVRCDRTTMSQDDIDNGRLIMLIGIAPVKPAEFVIFRIGQWTGGATSEE